MASQPIKRAILRFEGQLETGFIVRLELNNSTVGQVDEVIGTLPLIPELASILNQWQQSYRQGITQGYAPRLTIEQINLRSGSTSEMNLCRNLSDRLTTLLRQWLSAPGFQSIEQRLREGVNPSDAIEILLRSSDPRLQQLPWHVWGFIERYEQAELVLGMAAKRLTVSPPQEQTRILAILGDRRGIDTETDRQLLLEQLPKSQITFLVEPSREELYAHLWEQSWDILFFAGHSQTIEHQGIINLNPQDRLSLEELSYGLKKAINQGLKLAIFNSCDGLGLAHELEKLHLPQFIIMRESVPDRVAQAFLKRFLQSLSTGASLHSAVRQGREWLQSLEGDFPCASWLPILCQNPAMEPFQWPLSPSRTGSKPRLRLRGALALGLAATCLIFGLRSLGGLEIPELAAYDHIVQIRLKTQPIQHSEKSPIRVIGITPQDTEKYGQNNIISDRPLADLLAKINKYHPKAIGLDIFRDLPQPDAAGYQQLIQQLGKLSNLAVICNIGENELVDQQVVPSIAAPRHSATQTIGYADALGQDPDKIIRRYLLKVPTRSTSDCKTEQSFAGQLAQKVSPKPSPGQRLNQGFGSYQTGAKEAIDRQILINFHPSTQTITPYSLQEILYLNSESELQQIFKDSVVFIGYNFPSLSPVEKDRHPTPIGPQTGVMLHVHVFRQLLGSTPLISSWSQGVEYLWIGLWGSLTTMVFWRWRSPMIRVMLLAMILGSIYGLAYAAFLQSLWIPLLPPLLATITTVLLISITEKILEKYHA
jgi:CHASE2 domain-containing sensor protein